MMYALIPNIPLIHINVRPIKPNKLVMLYDKKSEKSIFFFHVVRFCLNKHLNDFSIFMSVKPM